MNKANYTPNKRALTYEGLELHLGKKEALECHAMFQAKYLRNNGSCLEYVIASGNNPESFRQYSQKEDATFIRYALMWSHYRIKQKVF